VCVQLQLWITKKLGTAKTDEREQKVCFSHAEKPIFTLDGRYLLYVDSGQTLMVYCLGQMAPVRYFTCHADHLLVLPVRHHLVMMTEVGDPVPQVTIWDFIEGHQVLSLSGVAGGGVRDVSKDGQLAVDGSLQVFCLGSGEMKSRIAVDDVVGIGFVRLTYDGRFVVWADNLSVKVGRVSDGLLIAHVYTHERPTSLCTLDYGYTLVVGCEDGRLLMMRLVSDSSQTVFRPQSVEERYSAIHGRKDCSDSSRASFDAVYRCAVVSVKDGELPRASETIRGALAQRARAPVLSTACPKTMNPASEKYRRSYSTLPPAGDLHHSRMNWNGKEARVLPESSSEHDIANASSSSTSCLDQLSPVSPGSRSISDLSDRLSSSVTDVQAMCSRSTVDPKVPPATPRTTAHKFLGLFDIGRSKRRKNRRQKAASAESRDRVPSV